MITRSQIATGLLLAVVLAAVVSAGCTETSGHAPYATVVIKQKFFTAAPMEIAGISMALAIPTNSLSGAFYDYNYYIITNGETAQVTKDVYAQVHENSSCTLQWGYVEDAESISKGYGYIDVVRCDSP